MTVVSHPLTLPDTPTLVGNDPVFHCQIDDFLPTADYQRLLASFPDKRWFTSVIEGDKKMISTREEPELVAKLCQEHPEWQNLFDQLRGEAFLESLYALLKAPLQRIRGPLGARRWTFDRRSIRRPRDWFKRQAIIGFQFSRLEAGSFVPPHTDAPEKLATVLLYFTPPNWQPAWGGETLLYTPSDPDLRRNWHNRRVPFDKAIPAFSNGYVGNRLFIFTKCAESLHGVPPIECPPDTARISLNINVLLRAPSRFRRLRKRLRRWSERREQRRHPY